MTRQRYCNIKASSLDEILKTCQRHLNNIDLLRYDLIENQDMNETHEFHIKMFKETWADLRDDVQNILKGKECL